MLLAMKGISEKKQISLEVGVEYELDFVKSIIQFGNNHAIPVNRVIRCPG